MRLADVGKVATGENCKVALHLSGALQSGFTASSAATVAAHGALRFQRVAKPDAPATAAPMSVQLLVAEAELLRERRCPQVFETAGRLRRRGQGSFQGFYLFGGQQYIVPMLIRHRVLFLSRHRLNL
jgi:hypothetical protein